MGWRGSRRPAQTEFGCVVLREGVAAGAPSFPRVEFTGPASRAYIEAIVIRRLQMATGIKDKVAILGMGCSKFGERWDMGAEELIVEAYLEAMQDAGVETNQIQRAW